MRRMTAVYDSFRPLQSEAWLRFSLYFSNAAVLPARSVFARAGRSALSAVKPNDIPLLGFSRNESGISPTYETAQVGAERSEAQRHSAVGLLPERVRDQPNLRNRVGRR